MAYLVLIGCSSSGRAGCWAKPTGGGSERRTDDTTCVSTTTPPTATTGAVALPRRAAGLRRAGAGAAGRALVLSKYYVGEITYLFIMCIASLGLMVLVGYTGQVSLGSPAFLAIGAYAHGWMLGHGVPFAPSLPAGRRDQRAGGLVIGLPAIRVSGLYPAMVTLAFAIPDREHHRALGQRHRRLQRPERRQPDGGRPRPVRPAALLPPVPGRAGAGAAGAGEPGALQTGRAFQGVRDSGSRGLQPGHLGGGYIRCWPS